MADKPIHRVVVNDGYDYVLGSLNQIDWIEFDISKRINPKFELDGLLFLPTQNLADVIEKEAELFDSFVKETIGDPAGKDICIWVASVDAGQKEEVIKKFGLVEKGCNWHFEEKGQCVENVVEWFRHTFETRASNIKPAKR